jgi:predicted SAM-dependent methyltransferase
VVRLCLSNVDLATTGANNVAISLTVQMALASLVQRTAHFVGRLTSSRFPRVGPTTDDTRRAIAATFLRGDGIEIGALHHPLIVPRAAHVRYVDRMKVAELRRHYPELANEPLVETEIVDDGETLTTIADATQDFVIANHFIEHCQNPLLTFHNFFRVLKPAGIVFIAVPDKRFTFDVDRPCTTLDHVLRDFSEGPEWSKRQHYEEWCRLVNKRTASQLEAEAQHLIDMDYSIHFHVWSAPELLEFVQALQCMVRFELELFLRNGFESLVILRKAS